MRNSALMARTYLLRSDVRVVSPKFQGVHLGPHHEGWNLRARQ
jgi:hypothetical protein